MDTRPVNPIHRAFVLVLPLALSACGRPEAFVPPDKPVPLLEDVHDGEHSHGYEDDLELFAGDFIRSLACTKASAAQKAEVNRGNALKERFLQQCARDTGGSGWCNELIRPNPSSKSVFACTYGAAQVHQLIHPNTATWKNAINAAKLVMELQNSGIRVCQIYNWWRPEPYNVNVGGAPGRHPKGTSVDVRFCSKSDQEAAHRKLCAWRKQGRLRALGYYASTALHFGMADTTGNTWGKACPP